MFNRVVQRARALVAASGRRLGQLALVVPAAPVVRADSVAMLSVAVLIVVLVAAVAWTAIWSAKPSRRKAALAVLDRLLRWKG